MLYIFTSPVLVRVIGVLVWLLQSRNRAAGSQEAEWAPESLKFGDEKKYMFTPGIEFRPPPLSQLTFFRIKNGVTQNCKYVYNIYSIHNHKHVNSRYFKIYSEIIQILRIWNNLWDNTRDYYLLLLLLLLLVGN